MAGVPTPGPTGVRARAIAGIPADVAMLVGNQLVIATGYLPQVRGFPLRGAMVDEMHGCVPGAALSLRGVATPRPGGINLADVRASRPVPLVGHLLVDLFIDSHTRIAGLSRHGLAYIGQGQRVRLRARLCRVPGSTAPKVVARRIVADDPIVPPTSAEDVLGPHWRGEPGLLHDRTTLVAAGIVAVGAAAVAAVFAMRRGPSARRRG